jgi:amino acid permease
VSQFLVFWTTLNNALYAYSGMENITIAAAETWYTRAGDLQSGATDLRACISLLYSVHLHGRHGGPL